MGRNHTERLLVFKGLTLTPGNPITISDGFPLMGLWRRADLHLHVSLTVGSASGPITDGEINLMKNLTLRAGDDYFFKNIAGRGLFRYAQYQLGTAPQRNAIAATTAVYDVHFPLLFSDPSLVSTFANDTRLDARRYNKMFLDMTLGTVADLFTTVGTSSIVVTADLWVTVEQVQDLPLPGQKGSPSVRRELSLAGVFDPAAAQLYNIERNVEYGLRRLMVFVCNSATASVPFSGTPSNTTLADIALVSNIRQHFNFVPAKDLQAQNCADAGLETAVTGMYILDLLGNKTNKDTMNTDPSILSLLALQWTNGTLSTSGVTILLDGMRLLR